MDKVGKALELALNRKGNNRNTSYQAVCTSSGSMVYVSTSNSSSPQGRRFSDLDRHAFFPESVGGWVDGKGGP